MPNTPPPPDPSPIIQIPSKWWALLCLLIAGLLWVARPLLPPTANLLAVEVFTVILALFVFGSIRYQIDKNAITYGALLVVSSTFFPSGGSTLNFRNHSCGGISRPFGCCCVPI